MYAVLLWRMSNVFGLMFVSKLGIVFIKYIIKSIDMYEEDSYFEFLYWCRDIYLCGHSTQQVICLVRYAFENLQCVLFL